MFADQLTQLLDFLIDQRFEKKDISLAEERAESLTSFPMKIITRSRAYASRNSQDS